MKKIALLSLALLLFNCNSKAQKKESQSKDFEITKTEMEWKKQLNDLEYQVLRKEGTEPRYQALLTKTMLMELMSAKLVKHHYSKANINMIRVLDGQVLTERLKEMSNFQLTTI